MNNTVIASIIICTYNGAHKVVDTIESVLKQITNVMEVVIIVDGSTDHTLDVLKIFAASERNIKIIWQENRGRAGAKNRGAAEARGDLLIFYDDDMRLLTGSVENHIEFHHQFKGIMSGSAIEFASPDLSDIQRYKAELSEKWLHKYRDAVTRLDESNIFFTAANCSVPRTLFRDVGGFDERLNDAEDFDFAIRAFRRGVDVYFNKSNKAVHHEFITCRSYIKRLREYAKAHRQLRAIHPERKIAGMAKTPFFKRSVYRIFASRRLVEFIDHGVFARTLPKHFRFRLYSTVIHALAIEYPNVML